MTPNSENKRVWFITGASKGLGYAFTCAALKAGDKVVAVARTIDNLAKLKETYPETLLPLSLDVTDKEAVFSTVETAGIGRTSCVFLRARDTAKSDKGASVTSSGRG